jgi:hypothetical protein
MFPWLTLALAVALAIVMRRSPSRLLDPSVLVALAASALFVVSFSQIPNVNSGGTPGMSRYGLWIVPMALPIFAQYDAVARRPHVAWLAALAVASSIWCVVYFRPETGEDYGTPSPLADLLWTRYPSINNPLPEIFAERVMGVGDNSWLPAVTSRCEKVLLRGRGTNAEPLWPVPCAPAVVPPTCRPADALCYANRRGDGYSFAEAPRQPGYELRDAGTWLWTGGSAPAVRTALPEVDWSALRIARFTDPAPMVRRFERTAWVSMLQSDAQFVVYLARPDADAVLRIESATPMGGRIVDPATGETLRKIPSDATRFLTIKVPGPRAEAVAILTRSDRKSTIVGR